MRIIISIPDDVPTARCLHTSLSRSSYARRLSSPSGYTLPLTGSRRYSKISSPARPACDIRDIAGYHIQTVLCPPSRPSVCAVSLPAASYPLCVTLPPPVLFSPPASARPRLLYAAPTPVQAVRDGDAVLLILVAVIRPAGLSCSTTRPASS